MRVRAARLPDVFVMKRYLIILGMPGAGKDTQAANIAASFSAHIIKTGDIARSLANNDPRIAQVLAQGGLVDDELINTQVAKMIARIPDDAMAVFDGFPRRLEQAKWLDALLADEAEQVMVLFLDITQQTAHQRLLARKRADDSEEVIRHRLSVFEQTTVPVLDYYRSSNRLVEINGEPSPEVIARDIHAKVRAWL